MQIGSIWISCGYPVCESGNPSRSRPAQLEDGRSMPEIDNIWYEFQFQTTNRLFGSSHVHQSGECTAKIPITFVESFDSVFRTIGERYNVCQPDVNRDCRQPRNLLRVHGWNDRNWRHRAGLRAGLTSSVPNLRRRGRTSEGDVAYVAVHPAEFADSSRDQAAEGPSHAVLSPNARSILVKVTRKARRRVMRGPDFCSAQSTPSVSTECRVTAQAHAWLVLATAQGVRTVREKCNVLEELMTANQHAAGRDLVHKLADRITGD